MSTNSCPADSHAESSKNFNRLGLEKSPYLLQHKDNPIWWFAWGDEAFKAAKDQDKPIFLSIGYSTCHWCHVMEHESFEDKEVADFLNKNFVSIKLDREERPDIDKVYMDAVQAMTGRGGWPMTVLMTPSGEPFFAGTYFPKIQFLNLLKQIAHGWKSERGQITNTAANVVEHLKRSEKQAFVSQDLDNQVLLEALSQAESSFDALHAGFGVAPKFPPSMRLRALLRIYHRAGKENALKMAEATLQHMAYGGIYDHLGGGFHRYSTDAKWLVPHFEKMLYDNALLSQVYLEAYQLTSKSLYKRVALETLDYVLRDMTHAAGGFYSAEDADSEGEEGTFYVWKEKELKSLLSKEELKALAEFYGTTGSGNFEHNSNILKLESNADWHAKDSTLIASASKKLFAAREKRIRPLRDDKILTAWNGLMIDSMALAYRVSLDERYLKAAQAAAHFIKEHLWKDGRLLRRYRDGESRFEGVLDDYAYLVSALIGLYQSDFNNLWLDWAAEIQAAQDRLLWDQNNTGYFYTAQKLVVNAKEYHDGAKPNANAVSALNLLKLSDLLLKPPYKERALQIVSASSTLIARHPSAFSSMLLALDYYLDRSKEIAVVAPMANASSSAAMLDYLQSSFIPNAVVAFGEATATNGQLPESVKPALLQNKVARSSKTTVYVCENGSCKLPSSDLKEVKSLVGDIARY